MDKIFAINSMVNRKIEAASIVNIIRYASGFSIIDGTVDKHKVTI